MSDAIWFYAKNDQQKGPVTPIQLKALATSGEVLPTDLVWKEGMEDWAPASEVKGLFPSVTKPPAEPSPEVAPEATAPMEGAATSPTTAKQSPVSPAASTPVSGSSRWANPPPAPSSGNLDLQSIPEPPPPAVVAPHTTTTGSSSKTRAAKVSAAEPSLSAPLPVWAFPALVAIGLSLVLTARGCDALGDRYAARIVARYELSKARFDDEWSLKRKELEAKRDAALASPDEGLIKQQAVEEAQNNLTQFSAEMAKEKARLEQQRWHTMSIAARDAAAENVAWSYWRQLVLLPASLVLVAGLLGVGITRSGPERWMAFGTLLVIAYSLFVGGDAWK